MRASVPEVFRTAAASLAIALCAAHAPVARADAPSQVADATVLSIGGEVKTPLRLDAAAFARFARQTVTADDHGATAQWEGVRLADLLKAAGAPGGDALRGRELALYVRISARDGYRVVYSLAELDAGIRDGNVIVADRRDGKPMDAKEGPYRIIAGGEKRPARWVRQVVSIDVLRAPDPTP